MAPAADSFLQRNPHDDDGDADEQVTDSKRTWSPDVLLELVHIWRRVELAHAGLGRVTKAQLVYDEFSEKVDRGSDACDANSESIPKRSRKAVEDKLYTMKQMYRFILEMNRDFVRQRVGGASNSYLRSWFDLTKDERRAVRCVMQCVFAALYVMADMLCMLLWLGCSSLHGIRIPNISQDVFHVLDSVLHAGSAAAATKKKSKATHSAPHTQPLSAYPLAPLASSNSGNGRGDDGAQTSQQDLVLDGKRNWSSDATMELAKIWSDIQRASPNLRGAQLGEMVYNVFKARAGGSLSRSRKAVEEKMQSMKEMYRFIRHCDDTRGVRSGGGGDNGGVVTAPTWFELTKAERRQLRYALWCLFGLCILVGCDSGLICVVDNNSKANKIRVTNLSREEFDQVHAIMDVRAEAEAALVDLSTSSSFSVNPTPVPSLETQQSSEQQQPELTTETNQSTTGVLGAVQHVIAQELGTSIPIYRRDQPQSADVGATATTTARTRAQKRPRTDEQPLSSSRNGQAELGIDYATADYLLQKIRFLHDEDRAERRRQHEEHMAAIRELTELVRRQQNSSSRGPEISVDEDAGS